jgi:hypothetical protein
MDKNDRFFSGLQIDEIWPVRTDVALRGISINWSSDSPVKYFHESNVGQWQLMWGNDGKLHTDMTYPLDSATAKRFTETILSLLASEVVIDFGEGES